MTLKRYLTAIILVTITLIAVVCGILLVVMVQNTYLEGLRQRGIELAQVLADDQHVIEAVMQSNQGNNVSLQNRIEPLRAHTDASFIVIVNQQGIRLSHPIPERVGKAFIGDDVWVSLQQGIPHTSIDTGSLGRAIRNFAPIVHENQVIGAVSIGYLTHSVTELLYTHYRTALLWIAFLYVCAVTLAMLLVSKLKRTFLEFEPEEIVEKFKANELVLDSIREGVIAIDRQHLITAINRTAMAWLYPDTPEKNVLHRPLVEVSQTLSLVLLNSQEQAYKQSLSLGKEPFSVTVYPLSLHAPQSGYLILLTRQQDQEAVEQDLMQTRAYANHLRTKTHEYGNKLNVLSGLLQAGQHQDAIDYLQQESDRHQHLLGALVKGIDNSPIAGMLMAKYNKASELGVQFILDSDSRLGHYATGINDDLISLIGNLVDNALYAAWLNRQQVAPEVVLFLSDRNNHLMMTVEDNGAGIVPEVAERMLDFGVTSKQGDEQNGMGLYLVKRIVDRYHGSLDWERTPDQTTAFSVYIDKRQLT